VGCSAVVRADEALMLMMPLLWLASLSSSRESVLLACARTGYKERLVSQL